LPIVSLDERAIRLINDNMVRKHHASKTAPAVALGIIEKPWTLVDVVTMKEAFLKRMEEEEFERAFASQFASKSGVDYEC